MFIINVIINVALSPLCLPPVAGQVVVIVIPVVAIVIILPPRRGAPSSPLPLLPPFTSPLLVPFIVPAIAEVGVISGQAPR